jgi:uncharacterized protein YqjF (DUF2071 family)
MVSRTTEQHLSLPLLRMSWETLTFVHWRVEPARVQTLLPHGLTVDEHDGWAWVSLTPFVLARLRPPGVRHRPQYARMPALARWTSSPETNLRTYVRGPDGRDGLWFLSLDIGSAALAMTMRSAVGAPYRWGDLTVEPDGDKVRYSGSRTHGPESYRLCVTVGAPLEPGELDVWLTSRWRAYTRHLGRLLVTPVEHEPWPLREVTVETLHQNLTDWAGLGHLGKPDLVHYSPGVFEVGIGRPRILAPGGPGS